MDQHPNDKSPRNLNEVESFDAFGEVVRKRLEELTAVVDELNEKSNLLEYEWVFAQEDWHLYQDERYGRCRMLSLTRNDDGTYVIVAAKAWEEDKQILTNNDITPTQYVRYVSPKVQIAHLSQGASRKIDEEINELSARFRSGDLEDDVNPSVYIYEAALGSMYGQAGVQLPDIEEFDQDTGFSDFRHHDIIQQAIRRKSLSLNSVRQPAWQWGIHTTTSPTSEEYRQGISRIQLRQDIPTIDHQLRFSSYSHILGLIKSKLSQLWNTRNNIDDLFFISPAELDPEKAGLYDTRWQEVIKQVEEDYRQRGVEPELYRKYILREARLIIFDRDLKNRRDTKQKEIVWSQQETIESLNLILEDIDEILQDSIDNSIVVRSLYGEMPQVLEPLYRKMSEIGIKATMTSSDATLINKFIVLPKKITVGWKGDVVEEEKPKTTRQWVESIHDWSLETDDNYSYLYHMHDKPDGSVLYAELRLDSSDAIVDNAEYVKTKSKKVLLAHFSPYATNYLRRYHDTQTLKGSHFHRAIHIKNFGDSPPNNGSDNIEFVHNI